jgi:hypothetical protein
MSIGESIANDVNASSLEVRNRAQQEVDESERGKRLDNDIKEQDKNERKVYANLIFTLVTMWLTIVLVIFVAIGQNKLSYSDSVIITLLTTTTANVITLFVLVTKYLFSPKGN